jgi:hypothetical protein
MFRVRDRLLQIRYLVHLGHGHAVGGSLTDPDEKGSHLSGQEQSGRVLASLGGGCKEGPT